MYRMFGEICIVIVLKMLLKGAIVTNLDSSPCLR
jgi:hypothetical protein